MIKQNNYIVKLDERRKFFQRHFPMKIGREWVDVRSEDILKNSCPVCGYLTLEERDAFDTCAIFFWEDDGVDNFEENEDSGPNHMTLKEGRLIFQKAKSKLMLTNFGGNNLLDELRHHFLTLDNLIEQNNLNKSEILEKQDEKIDLLRKNKVYGLEMLFQK